jgi:hypothetical protein
MHRPPDEQHHDLSYLYQDPAFLRSLEDLKAQGGYAAVAAAKAGDLITTLTGANPGGRAKFHFTRKGEYRIRNCRKVDLGCGYRIVCIRKGQRLVLLYIGTHDDCFRWIERRRTAEYDLNAVPVDAWTSVPATVPDDPSEQETAEGPERYMEEYEDALMERIDDTVLRRVFAGIVNGRA